VQLKGVLTKSTCVNGRCRPYARVVMHASTHVHARCMWVRHSLCISDCKRTIS